MKKKATFFFSRNHQKQATSTLGVSPFQQKGFRFLSPNFWSSETVEIRTKIQSFFFSLKKSNYFFFFHPSRKLHSRKFPPKQSLLQLAIISWLFFCKLVLCFCGLSHYVLKYINCKGGKFT